MLFKRLKWHRLKNFFVELNLKLTKICKMSRSEEKFERRQSFSISFSISLEFLFNSLPIFFFYKIFVNLSFLLNPLQHKLILNEKRNWRKSVKGMWSFLANKTIQNVVTECIQRDVCTVCMIHIHTMYQHKKE